MRFLNKLRALSLLFTLSIVLCVPPGCAPHDAPPDPLPAPAPVVPAPAPPLKPCPVWPHRDGGSVEPALDAPARPPTLGGRKSPDGAVEIVLDGFEWKWPPNISSRGEGCCGLRSLDYCARWQHVPDLVNLPEQVRKAGIAGGTWPEKIDAMIARFGPGATYWQDDGRRGSILLAAFRSKRMSCVDYNGHDPHYAGSINHVVCLVAYDPDRNWVGILDNNYPDEKEIVWMGLAEFSKRWGGWSYGLLASTPGELPGSEEPEPFEGLVDRTGVLNFGLVRSHFVAGNRTILNGRPARPDDVLAAIGGEMVPARPVQPAAPDEVGQFLRRVPNVVWCVLGAALAIHLLRRKQ